MILAQGEAMDTVSFAPLFTPGEVAIVSYSLHQLTSVGASATLANGAGTASDLLTVDDVTLLNVGAYYEIGSAEPVRIDSIVEPDNIAILHEARTWADNAQVKPVTVADATSTVSGLTLDTGTGNLDGIPDTLGSTTDLFVRALFADGVSVDTPPFEIQIDAPPIPPVFSGVISDNDFVLGDGNQDIDLSIYAMGQSSHALHVGSDALPLGWTFGSSTGLFHVQDGAEADWSGSIDYINSAGSAQSNTFSISLASVPLEDASPLVEGGLGSRPRRRYYVEINGQRFEAQSPQHAIALLDQAKELTRPEPPKSKPKRVAPPTPVPVVEAKVEPPVPVRVATASIEQRNEYLALALRLATQRAEESLLLLM